MMSLTSEEINLLQGIALQEIKARLGTKDDEYGATLFIEHHIEEMEPEYWQKHINKSKPTPSDVLELLVLRSHWDDDNIFDFTLPDDVTDNVISVSFNENGHVKEITMES